MTDAARSTQEPRLFVHGLLNIWIGLIFIYFILNVLVIESCRDAYWRNANPETSLCEASTLFTPLRHVIPAIFLSTHVLLQRGEDTRAELVIAAYSFTWGSFLSICTLMIVILVLRLKFLSAAEYYTYAAHVGAIERKTVKYEKFSNQVKLGSNIFKCMAFFSFIAAFFGPFDFKNLDNVESIAYQQELYLIYPAIFLAVLMFVLSLMIVADTRKSFTTTNTS